MRPRRRSAFLTLLNEEGAALVIVVLIAAFLGAAGVSLLVLTTTEVMIAGSFRQGQEASYAADAALERALHDLAMVPDWSRVLAAPPGNLAATFAGGTPTPTAPDGRVLDLAALGVERQRASDARDGPAVFGADSPVWRLYAYSTFANILPVASPAPAAYLVVWVADDGRDGDGDPSRDSNKTVVLRAEAYGDGGARRVVEAVISRGDNGALRLRAWHEVR